MPLTIEKTEMLGICNMLFCYIKTEMLGIDFSITCRCGNDLFIFNSACLE